MKKVLFTLLILTIVVSVGIAQSGETVISGQIINRQTGAPIPDVNVFLSQTTLGATTDSSGTFTIDGIPNGIYNLVFSFIGFKTEVRKVQFFNPDSVFYKISLHPVKVKLNEVVVTAERDYKWLENLEIFKREFIGTSGNAEKTVIKNPEVLIFKWNDEALTASSPRQLHIINNALGYEIFLVLKKFSYSSATSRYRDLIMYIIYPRYKLMEPKNEGQKHKWVENRKKAYKGSQRHFMRALYHDNVSSEYFDIKNGSIDQLDKKEKEYLLRYKLLNPNYKNKLKGFQYSIYHDRIVIEHSGEDPSFLYPTKQNVFFVDEYGNILNPKAVFVGGKWHGNRMADTLPLNYTPSDE